MTLANVVVQKFPNRTFVFAFLQMLRIFEKKFVKLSILNQISAQKEEEEFKEGGKLSLSCDQKHL